MAGMLGAFGRRAKHRYADRTPWEPRCDRINEQSFHRLDARVAEGVKAVAAMQS
jgi:hypothetical protein